MLAGLRPAELCGLRVCDVDFIKHVVHVSQTVLPVHPSTPKASGSYPGPPKTSAGDRRIPIPAWLCDDLVVMVAARRQREAGSCSSSPKETLLQTRYGNPLTETSWREKAIRPALRDAGLPESFRTYDLRHSHASVMIDLGVKSARPGAAGWGTATRPLPFVSHGHLFEGTQVQLSEKIDELRAAT